MSKVVLIGSNHAGTAAANTILDNYSGNEISIFEANDNVSYLGCGTALYIGRQIAETSVLFYSSKEALEDKGAKVHMKTPVEEIDLGGKVVTARKEDGTVVKESYDKLILATGSRPIRPNLPGMDLHGVHCVKLFQDGLGIDSDLDNPEVRTVATIGAGYIGVEIAEAVKRRGKNSLLLEKQEGCLTGYFDRDISAGMDDVLEKNGIELHYGEALQEIKSSNGKRVTSIVTDKGEYNVDMVIMAIGFLPRTELVNGKLETIQNGAIKVNLNQQTSITDVYAVGDCATVFNNATGSSDYIALATNAVRSGIVAGHNVGGTPLQSTGVQGSNGIGIYGYKMFSTGLTLERARAKGFDAACTGHEDLQKYPFMEGPNEKVKIRIVYDAKSRKVLGAQLASFQDVSMGLHMFSLAVAKGVTIDELKLLDIFFMPHFNQAFNYITVASLLAK
ncbi:MAG: FAD-dependent oxidoreductase [Defluviitaleaceae bacterium]|nr:FAD-dependent oxidoreductase [Defluviitaleaceae bacterium]